MHIAKGTQLVGKDIDNMLKNFNRGKVANLLVTYIACWLRATQWYIHNCLNNKMLWLRILF